MNTVKKIVQLPVDKLKPYKRNARKHGDEDVEAIAESIKLFGFNDPIGIWGSDNIIVEGHGRLEAAKLLGMEQVPCIRLDHLTDEQRRAYGLAHNKTAELSEWDFEVLGEELFDIGEIDMGAFGFDLEPLSFGSADSHLKEQTEPEAKEGNKVCCPSCGFEFEVL